MREKEKVRNKERRYKNERVECSTESVVDGDRDSERGIESNEKESQGVKEVIK